MAVDQISAKSDPPKIAAMKPDIQQIGHITYNNIVPIKFRFLSKTTISPDETA